MKTDNPYLALAAGLLIMAGLPGCAANPNLTGAAAPTGDCPTLGGVHREALPEKARRQGAVTVVVKLTTTFRPEGGLTPEQVQAQRQAIHAAQARVLQDLQGHYAQVTARLESIPYLTLKVDEPALLRLACHADVADIREEKRMRLRPQASEQ